MDDGMDDRLDAWLDTCVMCKVEKRDPFGLSTTKRGSSVGTRVEGGVFRAPGPEIMGVGERAPGNGE